MYSTIYKRHEGAFKKSFKEFCMNTDLHGYKYFQLKNWKLFEKIIWALIQLLSTSLIFFLLISIWRKFNDNPTVTSLDSVAYPVTSVPYPGIAVCNLNKISKRRAAHYAEEISRTKDVRFDDVMRIFYILGNLYDFYTTDIEFLAGFPQILSDPLFTNPSNLLKMLSTPCDELLLSCYWRGQQANCSDIMIMRLTFEGYCCTFNYQKRTFETDFERVEYFTGSGIDQGLTLIVNNDYEDYFFTQMSSIGLNIHVFKPDDYPDKISGSLIENLVSPGWEAMLSLQPVTVVSNEEIVQYPIEKRLCIFEHERKTKLGDYSNSDCWVDCRLKSMISLCGCTPFMIPVRDNTSTCTLLDITCLNKYKEKWNSIAPPDLGVDNELMDREQQNSLQCDPMCYQSCTETFYWVSTNSVPINSISNKPDNHSVIHVYFENNFSIFYYQDVVFYWFEILSIFGGISGIVIGISLVSVIEIFYFLTYKVAAHSMEESN